MQDDKSCDRSAEDYRDPLENYDPKTYDDPLERALAEEPVASIESRPFVSVPPHTPVADAIRKLVELKVACVLVEEDGKLVGVFSERDALNKVALEYEQVKNRPIRDFMTANPIYVYNTDKSAAALSVMAVTGYRHVPVVDLDQKLVGVVGPQRVASFVRSHFDDLPECGGCLRRRPR